MVSAGDTPGLVDTTPRHRAATSRDVLFSGQARRPVQPARKRRRRSQAWLWWAIALMFLAVLIETGWLVYLQFFAQK
jgi:hypothetical protein